MGEVTRPRMLPLVFLFCVFCAATWQQTSASCQGKINVCVAMDASQSLGKLNFLHVKEFTKKIADHLLTDNDEANFFAVAFARDVDIVVGAKMNVSDTITEIDAFDKKLIAETNTNLAIDMCSEILKNKGDLDKPSVIFIVTDGRATSGVEAVMESATAAAVDRNIIVAIGVGKDFAREELVYMAFGKEEYVLNGTFANLNTEVLRQTLETICHLSETDPADPNITRPMCHADGTVSIGVEVSASLQGLERQQLLPLLDMLSPATYTALSNGEMITSFQEVARFLNGSINNINSTAIQEDTMLQTTVDNLIQQPTGPKVAVLIIDDTYWETLNKLVSAKKIVEDAAKQGITVITLIVGRQSVGMEKVLTTVFGTLNKLSVNSADMESIVTSGFNQLLKRICTVLSVSEPVTTTTTTTPVPVTTTPQPLVNFGGALDVHMTFDICQAVPQTNVYFGTYGHFAALLANRLTFGPSNISLTTSLTYCSGVQMVAQSREYIYESHFSLQWARDGNAGFVHATDIVNDIIQRWDSTLENVGIIFISEDHVEDGLQAVVNKARTLNITLMAVALTSSGVPSQDMAQKAALIDASYAHMTYDGLYTLPGLVKIIIQRFPSLFKAPMQTMIGITLDGTLSQQHFASVDYILQTLRRMVNSVITDKKYTESLQRDLFYNLEVTRRANIMRRIEYYTQSSINKPDYVIIISSRPPLQMDVVAEATNRSRQAGVKVFLAGFMGDSSVSVETIASEIDQANKSIVILIDSSESVSKDDFFEAYKTSASLMWRLSNTVSVEVSTFDVDVHVEIPTTQYSSTTRTAFIGILYKMTHLMLKPPLYKVIEELAHVSQDDTDVRTVGVMFIADRPRYINLLNLFKNYIYANRTTLVVVDVSMDGDIEGLEQDSALYPMHIIRTRTAFDDLPRQILEFMNSIGYSKYHTVFAVGQIGSLEGQFNLFENMLEAFELATADYSFSTDFGLITMENNALFDYFEMDMDEIIYILRRLMKVSDRGSETALEYSTGMLTQRMAQTQKQGVSVIITDENPKFPTVVSRKAAQSRDEDAKHTLVIGVGDNLNRSSLLALNNVGDDDLCIALDGEDLRNSCVGWLVNKLRTLPTITPIMSSTTSTTTEPTTTPFTPSVSSSIATITPPQPTSTSTSVTPTQSTTNITTQPTTTTTSRTITPDHPSTTTTKAVSSSTQYYTTTPATTTTAKAASSSTPYYTTTPAATTTKAATSTTYYTTTPAATTTTKAASSTTYYTTTPATTTTKAASSTTYYTTTPAATTTTKAASSSTPYYTTTPAATTTKAATSTTYYTTTPATTTTKAASSSTPYYTTTPATTTTTKTASSTTYYTTTPAATTTTKAASSTTYYTTTPATTTTKAASSTTYYTTTPAATTTTKAASSTTYYTTTSAITPKTTTITTTTTTAVAATTTPTITTSSSESNVKPTRHVCDGEAQVGIGVTSSLQVRQVFETFQENITQSVGDEVKFKFLFFYNSQLFQATTEMKSSDPKALQNVVQEVNVRLTNLYTGRSNLIALILTDAKSAAGGISSDVFNSLSTYIEFVVFGIGQFSASAIADMKKLTRNKPRSLIIVDDVDDVDYDKSAAFLGTAVCDAVTKTPVLDIRTNITKICSNLPRDNKFGLDAENIWYPFDCRKFINCIRVGSTVTANVISCPTGTMFDTTSRKCDINQAVQCKETTAEKYALEIGKVIDPPIPKVINLTEECINNCFKSADLTDNYGYTYHPTDCSKFIVCRRQGYINPGYTYTTRVDECPTGQFWNARQKLCVATHLAECAADLCRKKSMFTLWNVNCRHFYKCDGGKSQLAHCDYGKKFQSGGYCVDDPLRTCTVPIVAPEPCYNLPWTDSTMYIDRTIGDNGKLTSCPLGKMYEHLTCTCSKNYIIGTCQPVVSETMDAGMSLNNVWMRGGIASFMGLGLLAMPQPSPLTDTFLINVVMSVSKSNQDVVVLSSCPAPVTSAFSLRLTNDQLTVTVKLASGTFTLTSKIQFDAWNHVYVGYNGRQLVLETDSATDQVKASGPIQGCQDSYILGSHDGFYGDIDELYIYDCIPDQYISMFN